MLSRCPLADEDSRRTWAVGGTSGTSTGTDAGAAVAARGDSSGLFSATVPSDKAKKRNVKITGNFPGEPQHSAGYLYIYLGSRGLRYTPVIQDDGVLIYLLTIMNPVIWLEMIGETYTLITNK